MADDRQTGSLSRSSGVRQALLTATPVAEMKIAMPLGVPAFAAAMASLATCYGSIFVSALFDVRIEHLINSHVQAVLMWGFGMLAVVALWYDRKRHCNSTPLFLALLGVVALVATLYLRYDVKFEAFSYVLLVIAALLNWVILLGAMNETVARQAHEIEILNKNLERKVETQDQEISRLARLRQFLAPQIAELVVSGSQDSLLSTHRSYIACLFCDIRGFTALSEEIEPEDVIAILQRYHDEIGRLVVKHRGTLGFRAGDGLMVFFNDPVRCDEPVLDAVRLAVDIRAAFEEVRLPWV